MWSFLIQNFYCFKSGFIYICNVKIYNELRMNATT